MFVSIKGGSYANLQRAIATGNPLIVRAAAAELERIGLPDALSICLVFLGAEPDSYSRAATRWHARVVLEAGRLDLAGSQRLLTGLQGLRGSDARLAASDLADLADELELPEVAARLDAWVRV